VTTTPLAAWTERFALPSRRTLIVTALGVLAVAGIGLGIWYWQAAEEQRAASAYAAALAQVATVRGREATPAARETAAKALEGALQQYPSASMAAHAALEIANLRYADRQYAQARSAYEIALRRADSPTLRTLARVGIASAWEAERDFAKAIDAYRSALDALGPKDFQYEETLIGLARVQELAGRKDDAVATYRRLLKDVPGTKRAEDVRARMASLGATP
jgi:tetratricopeptide (TPR) repeat protein